MTNLQTLPTFDPFTDAYEADPYAVLGGLLQQAPVVAHPFGLAALGYHEVQNGLRDRRLVNPPGLMLPMFGVTDGAVYDRVARNILTADGSEHVRLRRLVAQSFSPTAAAKMRDAMRDTMTELLDQVDDEVDVVELVRTYPIAVVCSLLGVPRSDWDQVSDWTEVLFRQFRSTVASELDVIEAASRAIDAYVDEQVDDRRRAGLTGEDLVSGLLRAEVDGDQLDPAEIRMLVTTVLTAGIDTTRNQLAAAVHAFALHPEQWDRLRADPSAVMTAVDEASRWCPIALGVPRIADSDTTVGSIDIAAGTFVMLMLVAANRDPTVFPDPDRFDIGRVDPAPTLTFGGGIHACLGVHLAKAELAEGLSQMASRWTRIELAGPVPWKPRTGSSGPAALHVRVGR